MPHRVILENQQGASFEARDDETLLDAAERQGITLIAGCRTGACLTCAVRLRRGRVQMPEGTALTAEMVQAHVVLPCVATASTDVVVQTGQPGRTLLHPRHIRPWTD